jgi:hypothetical protein
LIKFYEIVAYATTFLVVYLLLNKLKLKSLEWLSQTTKRRLIALIVLIFLHMIITGIIDEFNIKFGEIYKWISLSIVIAINAVISASARLKID